MKYIIFMVLTCLITLPIHARPVSYPGGWTVMQVNELDTHQLHLHYSPNAQYSIGYKSEYWRDEDIRFNGVQYNRLLKRWNKPQEQANLYFKSGYVMAEKFSPNHSDDQLGYFIGFSTDWETRKWFVSYENRFYDLNKHGTFFSQKARLGMAPYVGDYGDLHTWLMLQVDHHPERQKDISITPLMRFFKGPYMLEAGYSNQDEYLLNFIIRL